MILVRELCVIFPRRDRSLIDEKRLTIGLGPAKPDWESRRVKRLDLSSLTTCVSVSDNPLHPLTPLIQQHKYYEKIYIIKIVVLDMGI